MYARHRRQQLLRVVRAGLRAAPRWKAEKDKELAQREVNHGFPLLYEQATIALWSSLEALVRAFLAQWFANVPEAWSSDTVKKLRVRLGDYEALDKSERCMWVVDLVDQEVGGPLRLGVTRFETLLAPFGLSGSFDPDHQKALFELSQIRNALVHRDGVADKRLAENCPWLGLTVGEPIKISHLMWSSYNGSVACYVLELVQRVREHFGMPRYVEEAEEAPKG